ncbi:uncharacterized protein EV420DRAFT_1521375 [Desarmillaria tabescens]|uniref:Uncharacterized protein n=1 Tax=Armillaria tabescens TaxID=1929756 RepID=A0AA39TQD8_ARMTA|nr:uncharacterized protein EV420DRAFT_1521375 [Desarmillaria tabescens]KAK0462868.1 hypothetical protein EV420DRAFT_1521375 [Desarmillaria tabescens]
MSTTSPNAPICRFYQQGSCKYGSGCKNQHPSPVSETNKNQGQNPNKNRARIRKKGGRSGIAGPVDHRHTNTATDAVSGQANTDSSQEPRDHRAVNSSKSCVCFSWQKGSCAKGEACRFEHGPKMRYESVGENQMPEGENRTPLFSAVPLPQANKNPCYAWMKGTCTRGETCRFAHDANALGFSRQRRLDRENHVKVAEAKAEEVRKENERLRQEEAQRKKDEKRRQREEIRIRQEEEQRRIDDEQRTIDAQRTHQCIVFGSIVTFSSGLAIQNIIAGFDSCRIRVKDIPRDAHPNEIGDLFTQQGLDVSEFHVVSVHSTGKGKQDVDVVTSVAVAQTFAAALEGMEFRDEILEFEIGVFNQPGGMGALAPRDENVLTIFCRAPSTTCIVEYPDVATCRSKVAELNGRICSGRRVKVEMNQPPQSRLVPNFRPAIKVSNLPDSPPTWIFDHIRYGGGNVKLLESHSFDVSVASLRLRSHINCVDGVEVQSFDVTSWGDTVAGNFSVRVRFESWESAKKVQDALINRRFDFIDDSMFWFKLPPQELYTIIIPPEQYLAQASLWTKLQQSIKDHKACELFIRQMPRGDYSIQVSGAVRAAIGALKVRVESLAAGEKIDQWHQHLVRPPVELTKRITDVGAFMRADFRKHAIKLYGNSVAITQAKTILKEELDRLMSLQFSVKLERRSVGYFLRTGLSAMKEVFGDDCVTLDIRLARITIRGGEEVRLHLNNHIAESLKKVVVQVVPGTHTCPVCYDEASAPFQLVCRHVYCTACIRHFLTSAAETGIFPLVCMGNDATCGTPISIPVIQKFLPQSSFEHLLKPVFTSYVDKQPQVFGYCKTPDCTQIYRKSKSASLLRCPSCFSEVCSSCGEDSHVGKSCEEARDSNSAAEQERLSEEWIMQQSGIKKCPTCSCLLDKISGCNHIKCPLCGSHICWHCMGVFPRHDIYRHMDAEHGGYYTTNPTPNANNHVPVNPFRGADYGEQARLLREVEVRRQLEQERQRRMNRGRQGSFCIVM